MVEEGWCGLGGNSLMELNGCSTPDFPGVEYIVGSDGTVAFAGFDEEGNRRGGAPWIVPGVGSRCICKEGYEVGCPSALPEELAVRAVGEASMEGSAEVRELREEMFLMLFCVGQNSAEMCWDRFL